MRASNNSVQPAPSGSPSVPTLLRTTEAAKVLNVQDGTLRYWRAVGIGPRWIKIEGGVRYDLADLLEFIEHGRRNPSVRAFVEENDVRI